jgi:ribosomal protein L17
VQVLEHQPETRSWSDETGDYVGGFLIGTKSNEARWRINKNTIHDLVQKFVGRDFAIIPHLIEKPLEQGGGGHYFGLDTREDLLKGYADHSHGKYVKVRGPYSYNDGTDDVFYTADIKLRDSKAAAVLSELGPKMWVPYAVSPHIWPLEGPDHDITNWEPIGGALVIKGAYGPQAVISKMCKGTAVQCEKSLGAGIEGNYIHDATRGGITLCQNEDAKVADIISSQVSKAGSSSHIMPENVEVASPPAVNVTPTVTKAETPKTTATLESQQAITTAKVVTPEQFAETEKRNKELEKQVTQLVNEAKVNTLNNMFAKVKDEKVKKELLEEFSKLEKRDVDLINEKITRLYPILKASEEPVVEEEEDDSKKKEQKKGKAASLPKEPELPKEESKAASTAVTVNRVKEIHQFIMSDGGY